MPRGGARVRSGPPMNLDSGRSERRRIGENFEILPASGYQESPKPFPLSPWEVYDKVKGPNGEWMNALNVTQTQAWADREKELWLELWKLPQACAWSMPQYSYLATMVALYCRQFVLCEKSKATAADRGTLARYADTIGLTPQGLKLNGWKIVDDTEPAPVTSKHGNVLPFRDPRVEWEDMDDGEA